MKILAFESSCDETAVAVVEDGRRVLSDAIASQADLHALYGGVVPELASRKHVEVIAALTEKVLADAGCTRQDIDAVAVTYTPGLIGPLLVGVNFAKAFAYAHRKPLVPVNHIMGHIAANYLVYPDLKPPFLGLVVSGSHTSLLEVSSFTEYKALGMTRDDAAGEAFDKVARVLGIPYPGGAEMDRLASLGDPKAIPFPSVAVPGDTLDFSFSGLKTAVINYANTQKQKNLPLPKEDLAASFTYTVTKGIVKRLEELYKQNPFQTFVLAGGVSANSHLRKALQRFGEKRKVRICSAPPSLCTDNAAMIGAQGYYDALAGHFASLDLNPKATCDI